MVKKELQLDPNSPLAKEFLKWEEEHKDWLDGKPQKKSFIEKHWLKIAIGAGIAGYLIKGKLNSMGVPVPSVVDDEPEWLGRECILKGIVEKTGEELMSVPCSENFIKDMIEITSEYSDTLGR